MRMNGSKVVRVLSKTATCHDPVKKRTEIAIDGKY